MHRTSLRIPIFTLVLCFAAVISFGQKGPELDIHKCWEANVPDGRSVVSDGIKLFVGAAGGRVDAFGTDGKKLWSADLGGEITSNLLTAGDNVVVVTTGGGISTLRSLGKETGVTAWTYKLPESQEQSLALIRGTIIVVSGGGAIQSLGTTDGSVKWKREIASAFSGPAVFSGDRILVASTSDQLFIVSGVTGDIELMQKQGFAPTAFAVANGSLIVGDERGNVASTPVGGIKPGWKFKTGGRVSAIFPVEGQLLIASNDNFIYWVNPENGSVRWKRRLTARIVGLSVVNEYYIVSAATEDHSATLSDLSTGKTVGQVGLAGDEVLVADPVGSSDQIIILTSGGLRSFSLAGCSKKESGPGL